MSMAHISSAEFPSPDEAVGSVMGKLSSGGKGRRAPVIISIQVVKSGNGWKAFALVEEPRDDDREPELEEELRETHKKHDHDAWEDSHDYMVSEMRHRQEEALEHEHEDTMKQPEEAVPVPVPAPVFDNPILVYEAPIEIPLERDYIPEGTPVPDLNEQRLEWLRAVFENDFEKAEFGTVSNEFLTLEAELVPDGPDPSLFPEPEPG